MKQTIHLNEKQLKQAIREAIDELDWKTYINAARKGDEFRKNNPTTARQWNRVYDFKNAARDSFYKKMGLDHQYDNLQGDYSKDGTISIDPDELSVTGSRDHDFNDENKFMLNHNVYHMGRRYGNGFDSGYGRTRMWDYAHETTPEEFFDNPELAQKFRNAEKEVDDYKNGEYEYRKGEGWKKKDIDEAIDRVFRKIMN